MRFVGFALLGALSAGCALQTGDPMVDEAQRPGELVAEPGSGPAVVQRDSVTGNLTQAPQPTSGTGATASRGAKATNPAGAGGVASGPKDNPNPSPWGGGEVTETGNLGVAGGK